MINSVIGIFDSGVGGLSIFKEINQTMPWVDTVYVADQKYLPYGEKTNKQIQKRSIIISKFLLQLNCSLIVVACNTATVASIDMLRKTFLVPFVGVEPAVKPAAKMSKNKEITVIVTSATLRSKRQKKLIASFAKGVLVHIYAAPQFVSLVEKGETETSKAFRIVKDFLKDNKIGRSDVIVLGSTHYHFFKKAISQNISSKVQIIEPSESIARRVKKIIESQRKYLKNIKGQHQFFTTASPTKFDKLAKKLLNQDIRSKKARI